MRAEIATAKSAGFCFGVDRAVKLVYQALAEGKRVATLGPIVHNEAVVGDLNAKGARIISAPAELEPGTGQSRDRRHLSVCRADS